MSQPSEHVCTHCGACCAYFHVIFHWQEAEAVCDHPVPLELTEDLDSFRRCMKGTSGKRHIRCVALEGTIGKKVRCTIYSNRPSPCRAFKASHEDGTTNIRCADARAMHGLAPLREADFPGMVRP